MIKQTVGYDRKELEALMKHLMSRVDSIENNVRMMEEQGLGLRDNLDWKSTAKHLRFDLEQVKDVIDSLGVFPTTRKHFSESSYEEYYLPAVVDQWSADEYHREEIY
jgi:hypothetical protein